MPNVSMVQPTVRLWNADSAAGWKQRRDEARAASGLPAISDLRGKELDNALATERRKMNKRLRAYYSSTVAWPVSHEPPAFWLIGRAVERASLLSITNF